MSTQARLTEFDATGDVGQWRLATDEPGFYSCRRYWRTDEFVLVANQNTGIFSVYAVDVWESGILGEGNDPIIQERDLEDAIGAAKRWMTRHSDGRVDS